MPEKENAVQHISKIEQALFEHGINKTGSCISMMSEEKGVRTDADAFLPEMGGLYRKKKTEYDCCFCWK